MRRRGWLMMGWALTASSAGATGCSGSSEAGIGASPDRGATDAAASETGAPVLDGSALADAGADVSVQDASIDALAEATAEGAAPGLGVPDTPDEACVLHLPQTGNVILGGFHLAAAPAGGAYVAFHFGGYTALGGAPVPGATINLGTAQTTFATGVAVLRVDSACKVVWAHELGGALSSSFDGMSPAGLVADLGARDAGAGSVTVVGSFHGSMSLGGAANASAPVSGPLAAFLVRFDAQGGHLLDRVFAEQGDGGAASGVTISELALGADGTLSMIAAGFAAPDFGGGPGARGPHFVRLDAQGALLSDRSLLGGPHLQNLTVAGDGTLYALASSASPDASTETTHVVRLAPSGDWATVAELGDFSGLLAGGPTGVVTLRLDSGPGRARTQTLAAYRPDGTLAWSRATDLTSLAGPENASETHLRVDAQGRPIVGASLGGYWVALPDGSFTTSDRPAGAGFERFDARGDLERLQAHGGQGAGFGDIALASDGTVLVLGFDSSGSSASSPTDIFLVKARP